MISSSDFVPRQAHISKSAKQTTVTLEPEDHAAINWIRFVRSSRGNERTRLNDILRDALWHYVEKVEGKTKAELVAMLPPREEKEPTTPTNLTQMQKPKRRK